MVTAGGLNRFYGRSSVGRDPLDARAIEMPMSEAATKAFPERSPGGWAAVRWSADRRRRLPLLAGICQDRPAGSVRCSQCARGRWHAERMVLTP